MKILIVDGYNAINKIRYLSDIAEESLRSARDALTELADDYKRRDGGISRVCIVFDGKDQYRGLDIPRPKEHIFSKTGDGDRKIIEMIREFSDEATVVVASDDNYVRNNARAHKASLLRVKALIE